MVAHKKSSRLPRDRFAKMIEDEDKIIALLPMVHSTDAYLFTDAMTSATLSPTLCDVFEESLVYLFVGKPAYRTRRQNNPAVDFDLPIAIILKPEVNIEPVARIYPFDSGAFDLGFYDQYFHRETILDDFLLGSNLEQAKKFLGHFYQNSFEYFSGSSTKNVHVPLGQFEASGLHALARTPSDPSANITTPPDERSSSIEIQLHHPVELHDNVLGIIVPQVCLDDEATKTFIDSLNPKYLKSYLVIAKAGTEAIAGQIYLQTREIYSAEGLL